MQPNGTSPVRDAGDIGAQASGLGAEFRHLISDIEDLVRSATHLSGDDLARARGLIDERLTAAKETLNAASGAVAQKARYTAEVTDTYVHEQPWRAVGIAAAVGLIIGVLMMRR